MGLTITLAGQDITDFVDESTIQVESVLGQGAGSGSGVGSSSTAKFLSDLGPPKTAIGAGQSVPVTYSQAVLADSPSGFFRMDSQISCPDSSGNSNTGTVENGPLNIVAGATGDRNLAWETDGIAYVQTPLVITGHSFTIEALVRILDAGSAHGPLMAVGDDGSGYGIGLGSGDWSTVGHNLIFYTSSHSPNYFGTTAVPADGAWHSVAVTFSSSIGTATFFIDGVQVETIASLTVPTPTGHGYIGATSAGVLASDLIIDEVSVYATVLSSSRLANHNVSRNISPVLVRLGEVVVKDATSTTIFGGYVTEMEDASLEVTIKTQLDCVDYFQNLDRTEVNEVFTGETDIDIIRYIITNYAPDIDLTDIPASGTYSFDKRYIRAKSVKEALQAVAKVTGYAIWVTPNKKLEYMPPTDVSTAPFSLSDDPDFVGSFGYDINTHTLDENGTINRVYFYGGKQVSPDFIQDLNPQANGANKVFQLAYYPHEASDGNIHVTKNGTDLAIGSPFDTGSSGKLKSQGGTSDVLLNRDAETLTFDVAPLVTDTLTCTYRFSTPLVVVVSDKSSFQFYGRWLDGKLDDTSVLDSSTAIQRARVLLAQQSYGLETLEVVMRKGGLQAGMLLHVVNELRAIDDTYLVQKVETAPMGAGFFEYTVTLGAWNWNLVDLLFAVSKRAGVQDDSTEEDTSVVQAQETLEAGDVVDIINLTTTTSGEYYSGNFYSGFATIIS